MIHHTYHEVVENHLERRAYAQALRHSMPWYSGLSPRAARLGAASLLGMLGLRRTPRSPAPPG
jgi:hypothetical protein